MLKIFCISGGIKTLEMIAIEQELHESFEDAQARYEQEFGSLPTENVTIIHVEYVASLMQEIVPRVYEQHT